MDPVLCIVLGIQDIQLGRKVKIFVCLFFPSQSGGHNSENTPRKGGVMSRPFFIVIKGMLHRAKLLRILKYHVSQNRICLFADLMTVQPVQMIPLHDRTVSPGFLAEIPLLFERKLSSWGLISSFSS